MPSVCLTSLPSLPLSILRTLGVSAFAILLAACAQAPGAAGGAGGAGTSAAGASGAAAAIGRADLREPGVKQQLDQALRPRGWVPIGSARAATGVEPDFYYLNALAVRRTGDTVRVPQLSIFSASNASAQRSTAVATLREYDCPNKTWRIVEAQGFLDRLATIKSSQTPAVVTGVQPIQPNTVVNLVYTALCEGKGSGTGVIVAGGRVLTNSHVVDRCRKLETSFESSRYETKIIAQDKAADLALLEVANLPRASALSLRRTAVSGESVTVAGFPLASVLANDMNVQIGIVNSLAGIGNNMSQFQVSATMQPGNSGGPVLDKSANLLGLAVAKLSTSASTMLNANNVNFAIKPEILRLFLSTNQITVREVDSGARLETEQVAERARQVTVKIDCSQRIAGA